MGSPGSGARSSITPPDELATAGLRGLWCGRRGQGKCGPGAGSAAAGDRVGDDGALHHQLSQPLHPLWGGHSQGARPPHRGWPLPPCCWQGHRRAWATGHPATPWRQRRLQGFLGFKCWLRPQRPQWTRWHGRTGRSGPGGRERTHRQSDPPCRPSGHGCSGVGMVTVPARHTGRQRGGIVFWGQVCHRSTRSWVTLYE